MLFNLFDKSKNDNQLIKQYEICTDMADKISQRRGDCNKFYSAIMLAFISTIVAIFKDNISTHILLLSLFNLLGMALNVIWFFNILSYQKLNSSKYAVINKMEENMDFKPYTEEWEKAKNQKYIRLTVVEKIVPIIFFIFFICLEIIAIYYCHKFPSVQ